MKRGRGGDAAPSPRLALRGRFAHGKVGAPGSLELVPDGLLVVAEDGTIESFSTSPEDVAATLTALVQSGTPVYVLDGAEFCAPGMIDTHVHAPQYQFTGTATDLPLMQWLQHYTFPAERRMADVALAGEVYARLVRRLIAHGTTTAVYFGSIHLEATKVLVDACRQQGQRAFVGKVAMDQHGAPGYEETTESSLKNTESLIEYCHACEPGVKAPVNRLVNPVITPRFIPTCSKALLHGLGALAVKYRNSGCWVQSHCAESMDEMAFVESLHPGMRDTALFDAAGLLTDRCIMAHCVHLSDSELKLFAERKAGIACCPLSNAFFAHGNFGLQRALQYDARVGLGTDVAGGYSPSMLSSCRHAVVASMHRKSAGHQASGGAAVAGASEAVDWKVAFWTATLGGAAALGLEAHLDSFAPGKQFDAAIITSAADVYDTFLPPSSAAMSPEAVLAADLERYVNLGDDRNVGKVFVRGRIVKGLGMCA